VEYRQDLRADEIIEPGSLGEAGNVVDGKKGLRGPLFAKPVRIFWHVHIPFRERER
jgi:hypothetical protein